MPIPGVYSGRINESDLKSMKKLTIIVASLIAASFVLMRCGEDEKTARLEVWLTDSPGDFQEVNIDIQGVEINSTDDDAGWQTVPIDAGVYDLLKLTDGLDTLLGSIELPAGRVSQIRLKLGSDNTVKMDDTLLPLVTPSAQQSGLKLNVNTTLEAGVVYKMLLDFDAARSVVVNPNQKILKPVIRTIVEAQSGAVNGTVVPVDASPAVYAVIGTDTVGTSFADAATGQFVVKGLQPGTYSIRFAPSSDYTEKTVDGVVVLLGQSTNLGEIEFE